MKPSNEQIDELKELLKSRNDWRLWTIFFGIRDLRMQLALHVDTYPKNFKIWCWDCARVEGSFWGGPFAIELRRTDWRGEEKWELYSTDGTFRVVCGVIEPAGWVRNPNDDRQR